MRWSLSSLADELSRQRDIYIDLKNRDEVKIEYSDELEKEYKKKLLAVVENIEHSEEPTKKNDCNCEYSLICY